MKMNATVVEYGNQKIIQLLGAGRMLGSERDAVDLIAVCMENDTNLLLIAGERIPDAFLRLSTGIAGAVLQKFALYGIKAAAVLDGGRIKGRFSDFVSESNRGNSFRVYGTMEEAAQWLLSSRG
jgi:hypothetical protein